MTLDLLDLVTLATPFLFAEPGSGTSGAGIDLLDILLIAPPFRLGESETGPGPDRGPGLAPFTIGGSPALTWFEV